MVNLLASCSGKCADGEEKEDGKRCRVSVSVFLSIFVSDHEKHVEEEAEDYCQKGNSCIA